MPIVFITGASGTGKSTSFHQLIERGFEPSPLYLTRPPRESEIDGVDARFVSEQHFGQLALNGKLLESSLEEAEYCGSFYGSPVEWQNLAQHSPEVLACAMPANTEILNRSLKRLGSTGLKKSYLWVNLHAPDHIRAERIAARGCGISKSALNTRISAGVSRGFKPDACLNFDTSFTSSDQVVDSILTGISQLCLQKSKNNV